MIIDRWDDTSTDCLPNSHVRAVRSSDGSALVPKAIPEGTVRRRHVEPVFNDDRPVVDPVRPRDVALSPLTWCCGKKPRTFTASRPLPRTVSGLHHVCLPGALLRIIEAAVG